MTKVLAFCVIFYDISVVRSYSGSKGKPNFSILKQTRIETVHWLLSKIQSHQSPLVAVICCTFSHYKKCQFVVITD